jgi:PIN domain nuclease of toxin-antitoxin system
VTDITYVLDASAVLAAFFDEPGADTVAERMSGALLSAVNYHEIIAKLINRGTPPDQIVDIMSHLDVEVASVDRAQAMAAGLLQSHTNGAGLSLGGRSCLALALSRQATALTADRTWLEIADAAGVPIISIR